MTVKSGVRNTSLNTVTALTKDPTAHLIAGGLGSHLPAHANRNSIRAGDSYAMEPNVKAVVTDSETTVEVVGNWQ